MLQLGAPPGGVALSKAVRAVKERIRQQRAAAPIQVADRTSGLTPSSAASATMSAPSKDRLNIRLVEHS